MKIQPDKDKPDETRRLRMDAATSDYGSLVVVKDATLPPPRKSTLIELVMFLYLVARSFSNTVITNLFEYRTCRVQLGLDVGNCSEPLTTTVENLVQPTTSDVIMVRTLLDAFAPACLAIFIGPWSDANGRKPFLIISLAGVSVSSMCWGCLSLWSSLSPWVFLLAELPLLVTGGPCAFYLLVYCYISDVTDHQSRSFRMSTLTLTIFASGIFGISCAPLFLSIQNSENPYPLVFFLSACILMITALYTHYNIQESVDVKPNRDTRLFLLNHVKESCSICLKRRDGYARAMILLITAALTTHILISEGEGAIEYLSLREMFSWQLSDFTIFSCFCSVVYGAGVIYGVWLFTSLLGMSAMTSAAFMLVTRVVGTVTMAHAQSGLVFYLAVLVSSPCVALSPLARTELSRLVPQQDLGKVFAMISFLETISPTLASPLYTYVYQATFLFAPGFIYWLSAALSIVTFVMLLVVVILQKLAKGNCYVSLNQTGQDVSRQISP